MATEVAFGFTTEITSVQGLPSVYPNNTLVVNPTGLAAGSDGSLFIINSNNLCIWDSPTNSWVVIQRDVYSPTPSSNAPLASVVAPVSATLCYFLQYDNKVLVVSQYEYGNPVANLPALPEGAIPTAISAGGDGTLLVVGANGANVVLFQYNPSSATWEGIPAPDGYGVLTMISVGSATNILAVVGKGQAAAILSYANGAWSQPVVPRGNTWVGACLDGSYWYGGLAPLEGEYWFAALYLYTSGTTTTFPAVNLGPATPIPGYFQLAAANQYGCYICYESGIFNAQVFGVMDAPAVPFPTFSGDQETAFQQINSTLGVSNVRDSYENLNAPIGDYYTQVHAMSCPSGVTQQDWTTVQTQILSELEGVQAVDQLFQNINTLNADVATNNIDTYNEVVPMVGLNPQSMPSTKVNVDLGSILEKLCQAAVRVVEPEMATTVNVCFDVLNAAAALVAQSNGASGGAEEFSVACSDLAKQLSNAQVQAATTSGEWQQTILGDWGKLSACAQAIYTNFWYWDPNFDSGVLSNIGVPTELNYYQTLMPVQYEILLDMALWAQPPAPVFIPPTAPQYALLYQKIGQAGNGTFWWWICQQIGAPANLNTGGPFPAQTLIDAIVTAIQNAGGAISDFFTGANGWALPVVETKGYSAPPGGLTFSQWVNSTKTFG